MLFSCAVAMLASGAAAVGSVAASLPDSIYVTGTNEVAIASRPYIELVVPDSEAADASTPADSTYSVTAMLLGIMPIKTIEVTRISPEYVELSGQPVGIMLYSDGLVVSGISPVDTAGGSVSPGELCGIAPGDVISEINGQKASSANDMMDAVAQSGGKALELTVIKAGGTTEHLQLVPVYSKQESTWRAGIWIKESSSGLGMLTFITTDTSSFGGLGHAICDADTGSLVHIHGGDLMTAQLTGVIPGSKGIPGELIGNLGSQKLGSVSINCESGVYGHYMADSSSPTVARVAMKQELREGPAQMLTTLPGDSSPQLYSVMIEQINYDASAPTRNLIVRVNDQRIIDQTGGIVQGMSGSPIIQNGSFVAALTHVFVNDPLMGYGIFAENMLQFVNNGDISTSNVA